AVDGTGKQLAEARVMDVGGRQRILPLVRAITRKIIVIGIHAGEVGDSNTQRSALRRRGGSRGIGIRRGGDRVDTGSAGCDEDDRLTAMACGRFDRASLRIYVPSDALRVVGDRGELEPLTCRNGRLSGIDVDLRGSGGESGRSQGHAQQDDRGPDALRSARSSDAHGYAQEALSLDVALPKHEAYPRRRRRRSAAWA